MLKRLEASLVSRLNKVVPASAVWHLMRSTKVSARHVEWSMVSSLDDQTPHPSDELIEIALAAAHEALRVDLSMVAARSRDHLEARLITEWPGEHYRLLTALVRILSPRQVVEIGTFRGGSALALAAGGAQQVTTYDVLSWDAIPGTLLRSEDFVEGRLRQHVGDLADSDFFLVEQEIFRAADLIFVDGPKDGQFEPRLLARLVPILTDSQLLVFDDIRLMNMLRLWRDLPLPKLDMTSLGHWSGTGIARKASLANSA